MRLVVLAWLLAVACTGDDDGENPPVNCSQYSNSMSGAQCKPIAGCQNVLTCCAPNTCPDLPCSGSCQATTPPTTSSGDACNQLGEADCRHRDDCMVIYSTASGSSVFSTCSAD